MKLTAISAKGAKASAKHDWKVEVFSKDPNQQLVAQAYEASRANSRTNNATSLARGEVRGGGKKPWKQKGTGRARHGSIRSPIWRGGGVTFGPNNNRNYTKSINKSAAKSALRSALQLKADNIIVADAAPSFSKPSTKQAVEFLDKAIGAGRRRTLIVSSEESVEFRRSFNNIPNTTIAKPNQFSIVQLVDADNVIIVKDDLAKVEDRL